MLSSSFKEPSREELFDAVEQLLSEVALLGERVCALEAENASAREEIARLTGLKGHSMLKPSGVEAAKNQPKGKGKRKKRQHAARHFTVVNKEHKLTADVPAGSQFKGYDDFLVQGLCLEGRVIRYRQERWLTPEGKLLVAPLKTG